VRLAVDSGVGPDVVAAATLALREDLEAGRVRIVTVAEPAEIRLRLRWPGEPFADGYEVVEVGQDRVVVVTAADLGDTTRIPVERLGELDLVTGSTGPHDERVLLKLLSRPAHRPEVRHRLSDSTTAFAFLRSNPLAFMVAPRRCASHVEGLRVTPLGREPIHAQIEIVVDSTLADDDRVFPMVVALHAAVERAVTPR